MLLQNRHGPAGLLHLRTRAHQLRRQLARVAEQSCGVLAQPHADGARQRAHVHQALQLVLLLHVRHRVRQDQTALRVRVAHLHKLALFLTRRHHPHIIRLQNRPRPVALCVHHVLHRRDRRHHVHRRVHSRQGLQRAQHRRGAAHIQLHVLDGAGGLEVQTARVEAHALADEARELGLGVVSTSSDGEGQQSHVRHDDQTRRYGRTLAHRLDQVQLLAVQVGRLQHADLDVVLVADLAAQQLQCARVHLAGLLIRPHARVHGSFG